MGILKNFDAGSVKKDKVVTSSCPWTTISPGLAYCGFCKNAGCRAHNSNVVMNRGKGLHVVNDDIAGGVLRCPACRSPIELAYLALFACKATVTVMRHAEEKAQFEAKGDEIVKIAAAGGTQMEEALVTVDAKVAGDGCVVM